MDSTLSLLTLGAGLHAVCTALMLIALRCAPEGYEDETGFHFQPKAA